MREILFRGKRVDNGEWIYGVPITDKATGDAYIITSTAGAYLRSEINNMCATGFRAIPETVGQYTGLKDKNGTRVFEGDIIKSKQDGMIGVIRFGEYQTTNSGNGECHLGFSIEWHGKYSDLLRRDLGWWINLKIIGNIYDNPELLKGEQKMKQLLERVITANGINKQLDVAIEELSELLQAICKIKRREPDECLNEDYLINLAEEMADVEIILAELKLLFDNEDNVKEWKNYKLDRLEKRLNEKYSFETMSGVYDLSE